MPTDITDADLARLTAPPPAGFNPDYAKFLLACEEARRPKPWFDRAGILLALVASLSSSALSVFNAVTYWGERDARSAKEAFDNQITVARTYFDKLAGLPFKQVRDDALLYAKTALAVADLDEPAVLSILASRGDIAVLTPVDDQRRGLKVVALLIYRDIYRRSQETSADIIQVEPAADKNGQVTNAVLTPGSEATSYGLLQQALPAATTSAQGGAYTVFIQYALGSDGQARATALQGKLRSDTEFRAPGIEGVRQVPNRDQIRIYRQADEAKARDLQAKLGLTDAQIVNLQTAFPNLPPRTMEVWLGHS